MAATQILQRELDFDDLVGTGKTFKAPDRKYLKFADDLSFPRLRFSTEELRAYALRTQARRRFWEDLRNAAAAQGVPVSTYAAQQGAHETKMSWDAPADMHQLVSGMHDEQFLRTQVSKEVYEAAREQAHRERKNQQVLQWMDEHPVKEYPLPKPRAGAAEEFLGDTSETAGQLAGSAHSASASDLTGKAGRGVGGGLGRAVDNMMESLVGTFNPYSAPPGVPSRMTQDENR